MVVLVAAGEDERGTGDQVGLVEARGGDGVVVEDPGGEDIVDVVLSEVRGPAEQVRIGNRQGCQGN